MINGTEWIIIFFFSFLSKSILNTNEVNLFDKFRYRELLTYFSEVHLGRLDLNPTLNREISLDLYSVIAWGLWVFLIKILEITWSKNQLFTSNYLGKIHTIEHIKQNGNYKTHPVRQYVQFIVGDEISVIYLSGSDTTPLWEPPADRLYHGFGGFRI